MVQCHGGKVQNEAFIDYLRKKIFLPIVLKVALKTDLCPIKDLLKQYTNIYGIRHRMKRNSLISNSTKELLDEFSNEQLQQILDELKVDIFDEDVENTETGINGSELSFLKHELYFSHFLNILSTTKKH